MTDFLDNPVIGFSELLNDDQEMITLLSSEEESEMNKSVLPKTLPILPIRNTVLFPGVVIPITVGRDKSIALIKESYKTDKTIGVVAQKDSSIEDPGVDDFHKVGTVAKILKILQMPDGSTTAIIQGNLCFTLLGFTQTDPYFIGNVKPYKSSAIPKKDEDFDALVSSIKDLSMQIIKLNPNLPTEATFALKNIESPNFLINFISNNLNTDVSKKQEILEIQDIRLRAEKVLAQLSEELKYLELKNQIQNKVKTDLDKQQRDYFLNQQIKTIQDELGGNPHEEQIQGMLKRAEQKKWNAKIQEAFKREIDKLQRMNPNAAEYSIQMNYVETILDLPWEEYTEDNLDIEHAQEVLDSDHFGLEKVKERIIEFLAVLKLKNSLKAPILCLVGPPGVGKTSLGKSIAKALGRNYVRMSLGGVHDESEIRGHRKTYIGAMPGRIIQNIRKAKSSNPVFVLDEIDKVGGHTVHGDPSSALLEALDPEQNNTFQDNFLDLEYDLSKVMFVATANTLSTIQPALRDRMEVIDISGYIMEEKLEIAKRHLLPKQLNDHGIKKTQVTITNDTIKSIISDYTRESGVRDLEKKIAKIIRSQAKHIALDKKFKIKVNPENLQSILGVPIFQKEESINGEEAGVVTGLAWTPVGGEILFIESSLSPGKGNLTLTGNLGDVMKESATIAYEFIKSHAGDYNIPNEAFEKWNLHIHVPEGATPKDGPSAGITIFTSIISAFTQRKVKPNLAMTGEITLRGRVMPVGGIKEKLLAAKRSGVKDIVLCIDNRKDVEEIKEQYLSGLRIHYVSRMHEVIKLALLETKVENARVIF